jgi:hypothetical protein
MLMKKIYMLGMAALLATPMAFAAGETGMVAGHVTMLDADYDDGMGFGVRGKFSLGEGGGFLHGEYSMISLDDADQDVNELRLGGGLTGKLQGNANWIGKLEYIDLGSDIDADGFGVHGGASFEAAPGFDLFGTLGFLKFDDDDGLEFNVGAKYKFAPEFAGIVDYRTFSGDIVDVTEIRFALAYLF